MKNATDLRDRPVFICGHPKAGTSLVRALFDSHPQLVVYPEETIFFRRFLADAAGLDLPAKITLAEQKLIHIFTWNTARPPDSQEGYPDRDYTETSFEEVRRVMVKMLQSELPVGYRHDGDILSAAVLAYGAAQSGTAGQQLGPNIRHWVEKSPYNEYYSGQIYEWWPAARCIHVVRDPRDNYLSYRRKHPDWATEFFASNWIRSTRAGQQNRERYGAERYLLVRYEDLVQNPAETIKGMLAFLQIEWHESLTAPTRAGDGWAGNSMFADRFQRISAAPVGRWMEQLPVEETAVIEAMGGGLLTELGYKRLISDKGASRLPPTQAWKAQWRALTWPLRRWFYHRRRTETNT